VYTNVMLMALVVKQDIYNFKTNKKKLVITFKINEMLETTKKGHLLNVEMFKNIMH